MFCRKCGKQISDDSDFCQFCGIKILDIDRDSSQASDVKNDSQNDILSSDVKKESSQNQESYQNQERNRKNALSIIFDYKVYLLVVAILTSIAIILGKMNIEGNTSEVGMENSSEGSGITGELSRFIGASEETFLKETGLSKNDDGAYPSLNNMVFYFDNGEIYTITLNQNSKVNLDECSLFGLKIGDILEDVQYKLSQYEYVDTHDENVGNLNSKVDTYKITTDNSVISVSYDNWDHAILSIFYMSGLSEEEWGISEESGENFGDEARSAEYVSDIDTDALMNELIAYYSWYYGTNNVAAVVEYETEDTVDIRLYDPYATTTSNLLGYYSYDKNTGRWIDAVTMEYIDFSKAPDIFIIPYSSDILLTESDLEGLSAKELTYARNEIYARHGYVFKSSELNDYFNGMSWYLPNPNFDGTLYGVEEANTIFIKTYQEENNLQYKPQ
jgi:hypothetical protein